ADSPIHTTGHGGRRSLGPFRTPHSAFRIRNRSVTSQHVDLLAITAHRDDAELTCGGTLAKAVRAGHRVGIVDLTQGEAGTRGDAGLRAAEAERAARALGVQVRLNAGRPGAHLPADEPCSANVTEPARATRSRV